MVIFNKFLADPTDDSKIKCGIVPGALPTVDFGPTTENNIQNVFFGLQQKYANGGKKINLLLPML